MSTEKSAVELFGWSGIATLAVTICGGYLAGLLGGLIFGGMALYLSRWRKVHLVTALVLAPVLFVSGAILRQERGLHHVTPEPVAALPQNVVAPNSASEDADTVVWDDVQPTQPSATTQQKVNTTPTVEAAANETTTVQPAVDDAAEMRRWNSDVTEFVEEHPVLRYGNNAGILQEKLYLVGKRGMTNREMLQQAYYATTADRRWSQTP